MLSQLIKKIRHGIVTLRFSILSIFVSLFLIMTLLLIIVASVSFEKTLSYTSYELMDDNADAILSKLTSVLEPALVESQFSVNLINEGILKPDSPAMINYTYHLVKMFPLIQGARWGGADGYYVASQQDNDTAEILSEVYDHRHKPATHTVYERNLQGEVIKTYQSPDVNYDPRTHNWFINAITRKNLVWSDIYLSSRNANLTITATCPMYYSDGRLQGVFGLDIHLDYLLKFIASQKVSPNSVTFIVTRAGKLIAFPGIERNKRSEKLLNINEINKPWIAKSLEHYNQTGIDRFSIDANNDTYYFTYSPIPMLSSYSWLVGMAVPKSDLTSRPEKMHVITLIISLVTFILGIVTVLALVTRVVRPIHKLVDETNKIKKLELEGDIYLPSRIKEVIELTDAMNSMKHGLRSFQKYVPKLLVKQLIDTHEDTRAGGVKKSLAILFTDIRNFTTIAETMDPNQLMLHLCDYFQALSNIVIENHGTIDKYMGDSIMAFWGAPLPEAHSCYQAALTALACISRLDKLNVEWSNQGKPALISRVGIHMGEAIVGNLGSSERFNYTAIGDAINIASRLEQINKNYGTRIIVSDAVYQEIKDHFVLRFIDIVAVKGKLVSGSIYELMAANINELTFDIDRYREVFAKAFAEYCTAHWDLAIPLFKQCAEIYLDDSVAPLFIARCEYFKLHPPVKGWNGIWRLS